MRPLGELRHAVFFDDSDVAKQLNRALAADVEDALGRVLARGEAELSWDLELTALADKTLFPKTDSWYTGANIAGKFRHFAVYLGGPAYFHRIAEIAEDGYEGFVFEARPPSTSE